MKILIVLTYYRPHTSGLTIYAERLAKAMVKRGHQVTILTSHFDKNTAREEMLDGVRVVRAPVMLRISKGVIMPTFGYLATRLVLENDVVHLHLPQFDAAGLAVRGRLFKKPTVITYHCDLLLPNGLFNWVVNQVVHVMNRIAGAFTHRIVAYTDDYATHSPYLSGFKKKIAVINPPVELPDVTNDEIEQFNKTNNPQDQFPVIGMAARFATEKGVEVLTTAMQTVIKHYPKAVVWFAGPYENIMGEEHYFERLRPQLEALQNDGHWKFLGLLNPQVMASFYPNLDMLVIPSLNSTESFGLVQIEAMMNGVPSISSNLPGVRQPVLRHQMGRVTPIGDADGLAEAIMELAEEKTSYTDKIEEIRHMYAPATIAEQYEALFEQIADEIR